MKLTKGNRASIPNWIDLPSQLAVPDYIALDYKDMLVWEIQGTQFTTQDTNHSSGISLRFPRMVRPRPDKVIDSKNSFTSYFHFAWSLRDCLSLLKSLFSLLLDNAKVYSFPI